MKDKNLARAGAFLKAELAAKGYAWTEGKYAGEWSAEKTLRAIENLGGRVHKPSLYAYLGGAARISRKVLPYLLKLADVTVDQYVAMGGRDTSPEGRQKFKKAQLDRGIPMPVRKPRTPGDAKPARVTIRDLNCSIMDFAQELHAMIQEMRDGQKAINDKLSKFLATPEPSYAPVFEEQLSMELVTNVTTALDNAIDGSSAPMDASE